MNTGILGGNRSHIGRESYLGVNEKNYRKGFTLVELIVVLVILAILAAIAVPVTLGFIDKARDKEFVANAETSLSATQTVLNDVYNDGLGCLPVTKRIEAYNAALAGKIENNGETTSFKIWTSKKLEHGKTHATKDEIGSYTIAKALYISDGKAAVYDGAEWKIYDKESDAIAACAGFQNDIAIWPIENASSFKDDAYDPTLALAEVDVSEEELQYFDSMLTVNVLSVTDMISFEKAPTLFDSISFDVNLGDNQDKIKSDILTKLEEYSWIISKKYKQNPDDIVWMIKYAEEQDIQALTRAGIADYIADKKESFKENSVTAIEFTPSVGPKKITIRADFESVGMLTVELDETVNREYVYNIVDETFTTPVLSGVSVGGTQAGVITFGNRWAVKKAENSYDFVTFSGTDQTAVDQYIHTFAATRAQDFENNDFEGTEVVAFLAAADVAKKIYLSDKKVGDTYANKVYFKMGDNESSKLLVATVTKNELLNEVKAGDETVGTYTYTKNDAGEIVDSTFTFSGNYSLLKGVTQNKANDKLKPKWWNIYGSNADGTIESSTALERTRKADPTQEILESLYAPNNDNLGEVAEVDLSLANALLDYNNDANGQSPILQQLYYLAGGTGNIGSVGVSTTNGILEKINRIEFINAPAKAPTTGSIYREVCMSSLTTNIAKDSNGYLKRKDNQYDIDDSARDEEYPGYIVAYSTGSEAAGYTIYVFTEDDSLMKAQGSLQAMFACCKNMSSNTMVGNMDTSGITNTYLMFYNCEDLTNIAIDTLDTTSAKKMSYMFKGCSSLTSQGEFVVHIDNTSTIQSMFEGCAALTDITLAGSGINGTCPLGQSTSVGSVFSNSGLQHLKFKNLNFVNFTQNADDPNTVFVRTNNLTNGLHLLVHNAISNTSSSLKTVGFENVKAEGIRSTRELFKGATELTEADLSGLHLPNNQSMRKLFEGCEKLTSDKVLLGSDLAKTEDGYYGLNLSSMFNTCKNIDDFNNISGLALYMNHGKYYDYMFENCTGLEDVTVSVKNVVSLQGMFKNCSNLRSIVVDGENDGSKLIKDSTGKLSDAGSLMFNGCNELKNITVKNIIQQQSSASKLDTLVPFVSNSAVTVTFENLTLPGVTSVEKLFKDFENLQTVDISSLNISNTRNLKNMFEGCRQLSSSSITVKKGSNQFTYNNNEADLTEMFKNCTSLSGLVGDDVLYGKTMKSMYMGCTGINTPVILPIHKETTTIETIFSGCTNLKEVTLKGKWLSQGAPLDEEKCNLTNDGSKNIFSDTSIETLIFENLYYDKYSNSNAENGNDGSGLHNVLKSAKNCRQLKKIVFNHVSAPGIKSANRLFAYESTEFDSTLKYVDASGLILENNEVTRKMFYGCKALTGKNDENNCLNIEGLVTNKVKNMTGMFEGCSNLEEFDVKDIDTTGATNISYMFKNCTKLKTVDLTSFITDKIPRCEEMFNGDGSLVTIFATNGFTAANTSKNMFLGCNSIVGGKGTTYIDEKYTHAILDTGDNGGYFSAHPVAAIALTSDWTDRKLGISNPSTITGFERYTNSSVHTKAELASATGISEDGLVTMNMSDERMELYMWVDSNGVIKWWSNSDTLIMAPGAKESFKDWTDATTIDLSGVDFSQVKSFYKMFSGCASLTTLSMEIDTSKTTSVSMEEMFSGCTSLTDVTISGDWSNVTSLKKMFMNDNSINTVTFGGNVDMSNLKTIEWFFHLDMTKNPQVFNKFKEVFAQWDLGDNTLFNPAANNQSQKFSNNVYNVNGQEFQDKNGVVYYIYDNKYVVKKQ